jgi:uncharacterized membrane protein YphA (DoxX/SURF4 family)
MTTTTATPSRAAHYGLVAVRVLMGLAFFVFGLDGFVHFFPAPDPGSMPAGASALSSAFAASGYLMKLVKGTELVVGALLLANRFVPLALILLAPVTVNIVLFHAFLAPSGVGLGLVLVVLQLLLAYQHRAAYAPLFRAGAAS